METMTFGLLLRKVWVLSAVGVAPILQTMLRHGAQYYFAVFLALLFQVLGTVVQPLWQPMADAIPVVSVASVACSRLVLSLRGLYTVPRNATTIQDFEARPGITNANTYTGRERAIRLSGFRASKSPTDTMDTIDTYRNQPLELATFSTFSPHYSRIGHSPIHEEASDAIHNMLSPLSSPRPPDPLRPRR